ncbi:MULTISPECIES: hypothetical protein [Streptomyces]|uniref:hypothetical protein n=1 Tax=Streptomyces TaxID=1883 RepID=UPI001F1B447B|nr:MULTISPECIES: hypothetical protein [Streptomyces]MCM9079293.1 hypothetical protein [Streptomyces spororaveus]MCX5306281.1 hypothetical protein [Streptomyces sp. NBC_00160]
MIIRGTGRRWLVAALTASAVLTSGCAAPAEPDELPGVYRNEETGGEIQLKSDGTFSATDISADEATGGGDTAPLDFSGRWEFVDTGTSIDAGRAFVYLTAKDGELGKAGDIQLYVNGREGLLSRGPLTVDFQPDPDGAPSLVLTKAAAP